MYKNVRCKAGILVKLKDLLQKVTKDFFQKSKVEMEK